MSGKINVTFVDDSSDTVMGTVDLSPDSLPPSFDQETTLYIDDADWSVVDAQPSTSAEFIEQGSLTLRLKKIESVDPNTILFSLPTLFDLVPESGLEPIDGNEFQITQDDWRQVEFVSTTFKAEIESQFGSILAIHETSSKGVGWTNLHIRNEPLHPISTGPSWSDLCALFSDAKHKGLNFRGQKTRVENGFSLELASGFYFYGLRNQDEIIALGLDAFNTPSEDEIKKMGDFLTKNALELVDWCRCISIEDGAEIESLFKR